jgi:hypothetical protein
MSSTALLTLPAESTISTLAPLTGIPPSLAIGSFALNAESWTGIAPVNVRSRRITCVAAFAFSTAWTTILGWLFGIAIFPMSHDASANAPTTAIPTVTARRE